MALVLVGGHCRPCRAEQLDLCDPVPGWSGWPAFRFAGVGAGSSRLDRRSRSSGCEWPWSLDPGWNLWFAAWRH